MTKTELEPLHKYHTASKKPNKQFQSFKNITLKYIHPYKKHKIIIRQLSL